MVTCTGVSALMDHFLAYIDPGSGSLIIQAVIATIVAIPFFFRQQIGRVLRAVRGRDSPVEESKGEVGRRRGLPVDGVLVVNERRVVRLG